MFEAEQVIKRVEKLGDLFEPVLKLKQKLPKFPGLESGKREVEPGLEISAQAAGPTSPKKTIKPVSSKRASARKTRKT